MKELFIFLFCISCSTILAQVNKELDVMRKQMEKQRTSLDSSIKRTDSLFWARSKYSDSIEMARTLEQNNRNLSGFLKARKEREGKEMQTMWLGLGVLFLVIGIVGVTRKRRSG